MFHTVDSAGSRALEAALDALDGLAGAGPQRCTRGLVTEVASLGFAWGVSDGNQRRPAPRDLPGELSVRARVGSASRKSTSVGRK